ncbi:hypothetical protein QE152_g40415 [Popillia japonica]|uniref:Uncharacterized protein n=1 Tax=Popillia japonica TaxID=7064 RepID=A0AAW1HS08_POPJA
MKKQEKNKNTTKRKKKEVEFEPSESEMEEEYLAEPQQDTSGDELNHINKRKPEKLRKILKVKLPGVVTSEKWRAYEESQIRKNAEEERLKDSRRKAREMKKQEKKNKNTTKRKKKEVEFEPSESEMEEEYLAEPQQDTR